MITVLLWALALWRLPAAGRSQKQASLSKAILFLAIAMTFDQPAVIGWVDSALGINDFSNLLKHAIGLLAAGSLLEFVVAIVDPRRMPSPGVRWRVAACVIAALTASFFLSPRPVEETTPFENYTGQLWPSVYMLIFALSIGAAMIVASWLFLSARHEVTDRWMRTGVLSLGTGTGIGIVYALLRIVSVLLPILHAPSLLTTSQDNWLSDALRSAAILLIVVGRGLPLTPQLFRMYRQFRQWLTLRPLWRPLTRSVPHVMVTRRLSLRSMELWLHLRVLEISDAELALREYVSLEETGPPPHEVERRAAHEAEWLVLALTRHAQGLPTLEAPYPPRGCEGLSVEEELVWLTHLTHAFRKLNGSRPGPVPGAFQEIT
jgi:hypothetical protein